MASFNPKVFIRPDGLKRIANVHLIDLLDPWREYFAGREFTFPTDPEEEFPHNDLAKALLSYDPDMPTELMNGLYYIDEAASDETLEWLLERAAEEGIAISPAAKPTTADVAVQIHLARPSILEARTVRAIAFNKSAFQYYPGRNSDGCDLPEVTEAHLAKMTEIMNPWFDERRKGRGVRAFVFRREQKFWLVIRHGKAAVREGKHEEDGESGAAFYRPQKHDVIIYDAVLDLLGINAETKGERDLYRNTLGGVVFDLPPDRPSFITRVCGFDFGIRVCPVVNRHAKRTPYWGDRHPKGTPLMRWSIMLPRQIGSGFWDVGCGDNREDPALAFSGRQADQGDLPRVGRVAEDGPAGDPLRGHRVQLRAHRAAPAEDRAVAG